MAVNGLTFADYGRVTDIGLEEHFDGEIWFEAMWEARANLVKLLGEKEGRRRMQVNVIEGLKLQPPQATMIDARDAIILANRVNFKGEGEQAIWEGLRQARTRRSCDVEEWRFELRCAFDRDSVQHRGAEVS